MVAEAEVAPGETFEIKVEAYFDFALIIITLSTSFLKNVDYLI